MNRLINSKNVAFLLSGFIFIVHFVLRKSNYQDFHNILGWDILAYYIYLPFTFIYGDPGISNQEIVKHLFDTYQFSPTFYQAYPLPNGNWSPMYSIGFAVLYLPFFLIGHIAALLSDYPADGFSYPYRFAISNGLMIYVLGGLFVFRKVLKAFFSDGVVMSVLVVLAIGTNFFHEALVGECGPHSILFTGLAVMTYLNHHWHQKPRAKTAFLLGLVSGLVILSRASTVFFALLPLLWNVYNKESLIAKYHLIKDNYKQILIGFIGLSIFPLLQMIYWKIFTGEFIFNPYQVTPGFNWFHPQFGKVLFSFQKGWLLYTPLAGLIFIGLIFMLKKNKRIAYPITLLTLGFLYFISSWGTWWGGGGFGARYFVEMYAIMFIPVGFFFEEVSSKKWLTILVTPLVLALIFFNLFQTWQFNSFMFNGYTMNEAYYKRLLFKTHVTLEDRKLAEVERKFLPYDEFKDPENYTGKTIEYLDFDEVNTIKVPEYMIENSVSKSPPNSCKIDPSFTYGPTFRIPFPKVTPRRHAWLKVSFDYLVETPFNKSNATLVIEMNHNAGQYIEKRRSWSLAEQDYNVGEWNHIEVDYLTPEPLHEELDTFIIYVYVDEQIVYIDNYKVDSYERKW